MQMLEYLGGRPSFAANPTLAQGLGDKPYCGEKHAPLDLGVADKLEESRMHASNCGQTAGPGRRNVLTGVAPGGILAAASL
jgi:hypothetical protein